MTSYKITILNRDYTNFNVTNEDNQIIQTFKINPYKLALLTNDIFTYNDITKIIKIQLNKNELRKKELCGILVLENNKTYGNFKDKYLYKCIPNNKTLPIFYIPYKIIMEFSKMFENKYVTFIFNKWDVDEKPIGTLTNVLGGMNLQNYINYNFLCNDLNNVGKTKMNKEIDNKINSLGQSDYDNINLKFKVFDRRNVLNNNQHITNLNNTFLATNSNNTFLATNPSLNVFTIDNDDTTDYDDAISGLVNGKNVIISVYIANVSLIIDLLNLTNITDIIKNVSTIYLPNNHYSMLPKSLEEFCSLKEGKDRYVIVMDVTIDTILNKIINIQFSNAIINVYKNYRYEEPTLLLDENYLLVKNTIEKLFNQANIDSHKVIEKLMIMINNQSAKILNNNDNNNGNKEIFNNDNNNNKCNKEISNNNNDNKEISNNNNNKKGNTEISNNDNNNNKCNKEISNNNNDNKEISNNNNNKKGIFRNVYLKNNQTSHQSLFGKSLDNPCGKSLDNPCGKSLDNPCGNSPIENNIINLWNNVESKYEKICFGHQLVGLENNESNNVFNQNFEYLHISSPIRRLVDILNMIELQKTINVVSDLLNNFHNKWFNNIDFINSQMKIIKKMQNNVLILWLFDNGKNKDKLFEGIVLEIKDGKITVFIEELKMITFVKDYFKDVILFEKMMFKIFVFVKENTFKNKIGLKMV